MNYPKYASIILAIMIAMIAFSSAASAIYLADSKDWKDVFSVMLYASQQGQTGVFLNSESIASVIKLLPADQRVEIFESSSSPLIANVEGQLTSAGYDAATREKADNLNILLAPEGVTYYLVAEENYKMAASLASVAANKGGWVFIINSENVDEVVQKLEGGTSVIAVGNFRRDVLSEIRPLVTQWINNNNVYKDSQDLAKRFDSLETIILTDGTALEAEFFSTKNAVLLTGTNKMLDDTYAFMSENGVKSVVLIGNKLSVVGEQIRSRSNKRISVFVKFGYGNTAEGGRVYALSMFPLPQPTLALTVTRAVYDPALKEMMVFFRNVGSGGIYELTTLTIKNPDGTELGSASDKEVTFLGAGETLPITYSNSDGNRLNIPVDQITENTSVEFYTSFGEEPTELDAFLTMQNKYGPPFSIKLEIGTKNEDNLQLNITDVSYYQDLKRLGVTMENPTDKTIFYSVKIQRLITNGIDQDYYTEGDIAPGKTKTAYISAVLDQVDLEENNVFDITVLYGASSDMKIFVYRPSPLPEFKVKRGGAGLTGFLVNIPGAATSPAGIVIIALIIAVIITAVIISKKKR